LIERHGGTTETLSHARSYARAAIAALSTFADCDARRALSEAAVFVTERGS
jgi:geranylgeranyl pyrophosphate synthase